VTSASTCLRTWVHSSVTPNRICILKTFFSTMCTLLLFWKVVAITAMSSVAMSPMACTVQSSNETKVFPPSAHMHLGRGLSSRAKSRHTSCFDLDTCRDEDMLPVRPSLSESDLSSLFDKDENKNMELEIRQTQSASETSSSEQADSQDTDMCDRIE
jgi:hypothetical protein